MGVPKTLAKTAKPSRRKPQSSQVEPKLLAGGNPQIAKGERDAPVQAYIAAMPGWKGDVGRRLNALIVKTTPGVRKAVKWNSPLYGVEGQGWFLGLHCFAKAVKVAFFEGASLSPFRPVNPRARARATWISERRTNSTKASSSPGSRRRAACLAGACKRMETTDA